MSRGGRGGGRGGGSRGGDNPQFRGAPNGSQKYCSNCQMAGHTTQDCYHNKSSNPTQGIGRGGQLQQIGGKFCTYCKRKSHNTEDCRTKPNNNQNQSFPQNQSQVQQYGFTTLPQVPECNSIPIQINNPCQLCDQNGHGARECPIRDHFIPPQPIIHYPQTYQPPPTISLIREGISTRPTYQPLVHYLPEQIMARWQHNFGYLQTEITCDRMKMQDQDGDVIMENAWQCWRCLIPVREEDSWQRWGAAPLLYFDQASLHNGWDGYC